MNDHEKVLIVSQDFLFRTGLKKGIQDYFKSAFDYIEALNFNQIDGLISNRFKLAFIEHLDDDFFIEKLKRFCREYSKTQIVIISSCFEKLDMTEIMKLRIMGCVNRGIGQIEFEIVMNSLKSGITYFSPEMIKNVARNSRKTKSNYQFKIEQNLSNRELQVLELLSSEKTSSEIADILCISKRTVEGHRQNLKKKLKVNTTAGLIKFALSVS